MRKAGTSIHLKKVKILQDLRTKTEGVRARLIAVKLVWRMAAE